MESGDIKVPDLIGKNIEEAKKLLAANKLSVGKINFQPSVNVPLNAVIDQYPKFNAMAKENQRVDLFVNREVKKKIIIEGEEEGLKETQENYSPKNDNNEFKDDTKKDDKKKDDKKKDDKTKPSDKKDDTKVKPSDKDKKDEKKTVPVIPKDKKETDKKTDGGTKF